MTFVFCSKPNIEGKCEFVQYFIFKGCYRKILYKKCMPIPAQGRDDVMKKRPSGMMGVVQWICAF
jgi:hypothetical protein